MNSSSPTAAPAASAPSTPLRLRRICTPRRPRRRNFRTHYRGQPVRLHTIPTSAHRRRPADVARPTSLRRTAPVQDQHAQESGREVRPLRHPHPRRAIAAINRRALGGEYASSAAREGRAVPRSEGHCRQASSSSSPNAACSAAPSSRCTATAAVVTPPKVPQARQLRRLRHLGRYFD